MPKEQSNVDVWLKRETPRVRRALENASRHFGSDSHLTVHTLEAVYGQESSFGTKMRKPGSSAAAGHFHLEPKTARRYGLNVSKKNDERFDLNKSSSAAARYLRDLDKTFSKETTIWGRSRSVPVGSTSEREKFVLGAYNAGERHIADAQRLAQKAGQDPQSWSDVQQFLEPASPKKEKAKEKAREIRQYVEKVLLYEIEFTQKSPAGKGKTARGKYRCTEGGHWVTIDDRPVYLC